MKRLFAILALTALLALPFASVAQPFPDDEPPCDGPFGGPCPIDGGIGFLIAAGLIYGGKKAVDITKKD
jgi:hypothetical protein